MANRMVDPNELWVCAGVLAYALAPHRDEAPRAEVTGRIYRIVPAETPDGLDELRRINDLRTHHHVDPFETVDDVLAAVIDDGDVPLVAPRSSPPASPDRSSRFPFGQCR